MNRRKFATGLSMVAAALLPKRVHGESASGNGLSGQGSSGQVLGFGAKKDEPGVLGRNFQGGNGVQGEATTGRGVRGVSFNGAGVLGESNHGDGVVGESVLGFGVVGKNKYGAAKAGVAALGGGPNTTALEISDGGIKVSGAGLLSKTAVFVHVKITSNSYYPFPSDHKLGGVTIIDNPYCNNDRYAILFVTKGFGALYAEPVCNVFYIEPGGLVPLDLIARARDHWAIAFSGGDVPEGTRFNVMVIKT